MPESVGTRLLVTRSHDLGHLDDELRRYRIWPSTRPILRPIDDLETLAGLAGRLLIHVELLSTPDPAAPVARRAPHPSTARCGRSTRQRHTPRKRGQPWFLRRLRGYSPSWSFRGCGRATLGLRRSAPAISVLPGEDRGNREPAVAEPAFPVRPPGVTRAIDEDDWIPPTGGTQDAPQRAGRLSWLSWRTRHLLKKQNADWKTRRCHLLAPPGRRPVDSRSLSLPLDPQAEALGLPVSEALTAAHEKVVPLAHWDVVLVEHPALLDAAGARWGRCLGTRGEEQNGCDESGTRHRASSLRHAEDGAQTPK